MYTYVANVCATLVCQYENGLQFLDIEIFVCLSKLLASLGALLICSRIIIIIIIKFLAFRALYPWREIRSAQQILSLWVYNPELWAQTPLFLLTNPVKSIIMNYCIIMCHIIWRSEFVSNHSVSDMFPKCASRQTLKKLHFCCSCVSPLLLSHCPCFRAVC
jgi:ABC-type multidrug transport system permease subunit